MTTSDIFIFEPSTIEEADAYCLWQGFKTEI